MFAGPCRLGLLGEDSDLRWNHVDLSFSRHSNRLELHSPQARLQIELPLATLVQKGREVLSDTLGETEAHRPALALLNCEREY